MMEPVKELHQHVCRLIGEAHLRLMTDVEFIREKQKDWAKADLNTRARWAQYTLEVHELECRRLWLERQMADTASMSETWIPISDKLEESPSGA